MIPGDEQRDAASGHAVLEREGPERRRVLGQLRRGFEAFISLLLVRLAHERCTFPDVPARSIVLTGNGPMWHRVDGVTAAMSREDAIDA